MTGAETFRLDAARNLLLDAAGRRFDPSGRLWLSPVGDSPAAAALSLREAVMWLQRSSGQPQRMPVSVIGPRDADAAQYAAAEMLGMQLADLGFSIACGGRQGVMEAVCRGAASRGGLSVGFLPEPHIDAANPYLTLPLATGLGEARNVLVARAGFCLVAIGDSYGTLSEVALGLQFGRPVFGLCGAAKIPGLRECRDTEDAADHVCRAALGLIAGPAPRA